MFDFSRISCQMCMYLKLNYVIAIKTRLLGSMQHASARLHICLIE